MVLSQVAIGRDNNFNLLRMIAAIMVLISHSYALATGDRNQEPFENYLGMNMGNIAVDIFFITSGFLITASCINSSTLRYIESRVLRIFPAIIFCTIITIIFMGLFVTNNDFSSYFFNKETLRFLIKNIILVDGIQYTLPGVFINNPYENAVNGSLWSLPSELNMYLLIFISFYFSKFFLGIKKLVLILYISSLLLSLSNIYFDLNSPMFLKLFTLFFGGACYYCHRESVPFSKIVIVSFPFIFLLPIINVKLYHMAYTLFLPIFLLNIVYVKNKWTLKYNSVGDYSYGLYIYAFPIQQYIMSIDKNLSPIMLILYSLIISLIFSIISWHLVEKKCLKLKGKVYLIFSRKIYVNKSRSL